MTNERDPFILLEKKHVSRRVPSILPVITKSFVVRRRVSGGRRCHSWSNAYGEVVVSDRTGIVIGTVLDITQFPDYR